MEIIAPYTMRGLTTGFVPVGGEERSGRCIVIGLSFPSWLFHCTNFGFNIENVLLKNNVFQESISKLCGASIRIWSGPDWPKIISSWPRYCKAVLCFLEGRVTAEILSLMTALGIEEVISTVRPRRSVPGWQFAFRDVNHSKVGGITEESATIVRHSRTLLTGLPLPLGVYIPRDATTVLDQAVFSHRFRAKPSSKVVIPLRVFNLGTILQPYFHGSGWLPSGIDRNTWVVTPVLNSPQHGGRWGLRQLTGKEILLAHDASAHQVALLGPLQDNDIFLATLMPGKCLTEGFKTLFNGGGSLGTGELLGFRGGNAKGGVLTSTCPDDLLALSGPNDGLLIQAPTSRTEDTSSISNDGLSSKTGLIDELAKKDLHAITREKRERLASKADDAEIPEYLWCEHLVDDGIGWTWDEVSRPQFQSSINFLRSRMLAWWKSNVRRTFLAWLKKKKGWIPGSKFDSLRALVRFEGVRYVWERALINGPREYRRWWLARFGYGFQDLISGRDAVVRAAQSTWWNWDDGSRPFHWRWPDEYQEYIRDGIPVSFIEHMKPYRVPQGDEKDPTMKAQLIEKLQKARDRRYIAPGQVESLTAFFGVKKSDTDIRPVYDGSVSGLNDSIWMPRFVLPTIQTHLRQVEAGTFMCDLDVGEMFLNFILCERIRPLAGVDLTHYVPSPSGTGPVWECWQRAAMGLTSSPYQACQGIGFAEELIRGDPLDPTNIFRWDRVRLNLPGSTDYDPTRPWVSKVRDDDGHIAVDFCTFVDDVRPTGPSKKEAWLAARKIGSSFSYLGIQDAPRKRRDSSQRPGAWTGSVLRTDEGQVRLLIGEDKWVKTKGLLVEMKELLARSPKTLPRKRLEQIRGYLVHIAQTYPMFASYLIGLHMTIDFWRPNRDRDGWRFSTAYVLGMKAAGDWPEDYDSCKGPLTVEAVPRLAYDIEALTTLTCGPLPLLRRVRGQRIGRVLYGFGDASKSAFGATIQIEGRIQYEYGQWSSEIVETKSSNWRELSNLVFSLCGLAEDGTLRGYELFMFTDNTTAEAAFWKGTSASPLLFELVLRLKRLEMDHDIILHVIHVSGKRMIAQGTDGLSRADHTQGVMQGRPIEDFIPLHLDPFAREPTLKNWVMGITKGLSIQILSPEGWYTTGHTVGTFLWAPAPAAAEVVVEQLGRARLKRPQSMHIILVPRVMTGRWRRLLTRGSECYLRIDWEDVWDLPTHFEPLLMFVCLPYRSHAPLPGAQKELLDTFQRTLLGPGLSEVSAERRRHLLRKFLLHARSLCPV